MAKLWAVAHTRLLNAVVSAQIPEFLSHNFVQRRTWIAALTFALLPLLATSGSALLIAKTRNRAARSTLAFLSSAVVTIVASATALLYALLCTAGWSDWAANGSYLLDFYHQARVALAIGVGSSLIAAVVGVLSILFAHDYHRRPRLSISWVFVLAAAGSAALALRTVGSLEDFLLNSTAALDANAFVAARLSAIASALTLAIATSLSALAAAGLVFALNRRRQPAEKESSLWVLMPGLSLLFLASCAVLEYGRFDAFYALRSRPVTNQWVPEDLIRLAGARHVWSRYEEDHQLLEYTLAAEYPAPSVIDSLSDRLVARGWRPLANDWYTPSEPSGFVRGWQREPVDLAGAIRLSWSAQWKNARGELLNCALGYVPPTGVETRGCSRYDSAGALDTSSLHVFFEKMSATEVGRYGSSSAASRAAIPLLSPEARPNTQPAP